MQALDQWLADHIKVKEVKVGGDPDLGELRVDIEYILLETRTGQRVEVKVS